MPVKCSIIIVFSLYNCAYFINSFVRTTHPNWSHLLLYEFTMFLEPPDYFSGLHEAIFMCYSTGNTIRVKETRSYNTKFKGLLAIWKLFMLVPIAGKIVPVSTAFSFLHVKVRKNPQKRGKWLLENKGMKINPRKPASPTVGTTESTFSGTPEWSKCKCRFLSALLLASNASSHIEAQLCAGML